jgi:hypothetical protein
MKDAENRARIGVDILDKTWLDRSIFHVGVHQPFRCVLMIGERDYDSLSCA